MYVECDGDQLITYKLDKKYEDLLQIFKNDIPYSNIHYDKFVTKIDYNGSKDIKISTDKNEKYEADIVIFTGSLGMLKTQGKELFHPALENDKLEAIDKIGFGVVDKIYLEFEDHFPVDQIQFLFKNPIDFTKEGRYWVMAYIFVARFQNEKKIANTI